MASLAKDVHRSREGGRLANHALSTPDQIPPSHGRTPCAGSSVPPALDPNSYGLSRALRRDVERDAAIQAICHMRFLSLIVSVILIALHGVVFAQGSTVAGAVSDRQGRVLRDVTVTATPQSGGVSWHTKSASDGTYRFEGLPDATYRVDFDLRDFGVVRRNHVRVRRGIDAKVDAALPLRPVCDCVLMEPPSPWAQRVGQVIDKAGHPLPHARVELVGRQELYTDNEGRFLIRLPVNETWPLTATDTGFRGGTHWVSGDDAASVVITLEFIGVTSVPDLEHFNGCECAGYLLPYDRR